MKLPNWFKISWWLLLTAVITWFLYNRYPDLVSGRAASADIVAFVIWVALLLAPLFNEVTLLGITLKQEAEELKKFVATQVSDIRTEVRNAVDIRTTFSPHITIPAPAADSQLPELEARIKAAVSGALASHGLKPQETPPPELSVGEDISFLFATRYNIEKELRRIIQSRELSPQSRRPLPVFQLSRMLAETGLIEPRLEHAIREVYAVCSPAIHGEPVTEAQVAFAKDVGPELVAALSSIS